MARLTYISLLVIPLLFGVNCNKADVYKEKGKTLDSLNGVVSSTIRAFQLGVDSVSLEKSILRFEYYREFIRQNVNDTLEKGEADDLRHFYSAGNNLSSFSINRKQILQRVFLINQQLQNLSKDVLEKNIEPERLNKYTAQEASEVRRIVDLAYAQQKLYQTRQEEFKIALKGMENLIRRRNNGELPQIIKDTISL